MEAKEYSLIETQLPWVTIEWWLTKTLHWQGFVSQKGMGDIDNAAANVQAAVDAGNWQQATILWSVTESVVMNVAHNVNFYNVLATEDIYRNKFSPHSRDLSFMAPEIRQ